MACELPQITNGNVTCIREDGNTEVEIPHHTDICTATCNIGYWPNHSAVECAMVADDVAQFNESLECEGKDP